MKSKFEFKLPDLNKCKIAIIGLGYVGLPLAINFAKIKKCKRTGQSLRREVIGFDINEQRINDLKKGVDSTKEIDEEDKKIFQDINLTFREKELISADVFIITVPTPIKESKNPDLEPLINASKTVGDILKQKNTSFKDKSIKQIIIYESTVYPGLTEEICVPIIEKNSNLEFNTDFFCGYSPERINPGDKKHTLSNIKKVTSGSNDDVAKWVDSLYGSIISAGTFLAKSIKIAEAAKVIENTQRDINIALMNELAIIFKKLNIDTLDVLEAAKSKWNFLDFKPGLVGGHCIGVDPYYLTYKAQSVGYLPQIVLSGRRINDGMSRWIIEQIILELTNKGKSIRNSNVLILGLTFKENCPDLRNSKILDLIIEAKSYDMNVAAYDPEVKSYKGIEKIKEEFKLITSLSSKENDNSYDVIICALGHKEFLGMTTKDWKKFTKNDSIIFDIKGIVPRELNPIRI
ncbi:MAG: nucleotide sugar dehydrogenase [Prochlorococcus marinus XMU1423]|nr:nucleotide sugar dehydrogenase [Prochlorococcus marinus XMU1423]